MSSKFGRVFGKIIVILLFIAFAILYVMVGTTKMLPTRYYVIAGLMLAALTLIVGLLTWAGRKKGLIAGTILAVILIIVSVVGIHMIWQALDTAKAITTVGTETAEVGLYIRVEDQDTYDPADSSNVTGILASLDRDNTDAALEEIQTDYGISLATAEYDSLADLADAILTDQTVNAILLNSAYLDVLEEMDGYEDIMDRIVLYSSHTVSTEVDTSDVALEGDTFTVFISGIDSRSGMIAKSRSDANILAVANTATHQCLLLSTPRDYYVPLSISNGAKDKLTHAGIYGINVCMDTMSMLYDVDVHYYFRVNFSGFVDIIDALGGITVYSDYTFTSQNVKGYSYVAGANQLDGEAALAFCRERYAFASGDIQRSKNQVAVIKGVLNKMLSTDMLLNYSSVLNSLEGSFETSVPYDLIADLVRDQLDGGGDWNIVSYTTSGTAGSEIPYSMNTYASVLIPDEDTVATAKQLIQDVYDGKVISAPES